MVERIALSGPIPSTNVVFVQFKPDCTACSLHTIRRLPISERIGLIATADDFHLTNMTSYRLHIVHLCSLAAATCQLLNIYWARLSIETILALSLVSAVDNVEEGNIVSWNRHKTSYDKLLPLLIIPNIVKLQPIHKIPYFISRQMQIHKNLRIHHY